MSYEVKESDIAAWIVLNEQLLMKTSDQNVMKIVKSNVNLKGSKPELIIETAIENMSCWSETSFRNNSLFNQGNNSGFIVKHLLKPVFSCLPAFEIVLKLMSLTIRILPKTFPSSVKIALNMMKKNKQTEQDSQALLSVITCMSSDITWIIKTLHQNTNEALLKIANAQIKLIKNLLSQNSSSVAVAVIMMKTLAELRSFNKTNTLNPPLNDLIYGYNQTIFTSGHDWNVLKNTEQLQKNEIDFYYQLCVEVLNQQNENHNIECSTILMLVEALSRDLMLLPSSTADQVIVSIVRYLQSPRLPQEDFQTIERRLVHGIMNGNVVSFVVMKEFLLFVNLPIAQEQYFKFFQSLLLKTWKPPSIPILPSQIYLMSILHMMLRHYATTQKRGLAEQCILEYFKLCRTRPETFTQDFEETVKHPTTQNFYKLLLGLESLKQENSKPINKQQLESLQEVMQEMAENDFLVEAIAVSVIDVIISRLHLDKESRMCLLVKLFPLINRVSSKSNKLRLKLVDLFSILEKEANGTIGISQLIEKGLEKLAKDPNICVRRALRYKLNTSFDKQSRHCRPVQNLLNNESFCLPSSERRLSTTKKHLCQAQMKVTQVQSSPKQSEKLLLIKSYSENISKENLSTDDLRVVRVIVDNLNKLLTQ